MPHASLVLALSLTPSVFCLLSSVCLLSVCHTFPEFAVRSISCKSFQFYILSQVVTVVPSRHQLSQFITSYHKLSKVVKSCQKLSKGLISCHKSFQVVTSQCESLQRVNSCKKSSKIFISCKKSIQVVISLYNLHPNCLYVVLIVSNCLNMLQIVKIHYKLAQNSAIGICHSLQALTICPNLSRLCSFTTFFPKFQNYDIFKM